MLRGMAGPTPDVHRRDPRPSTRSLIHAANPSLTYTPNACSIMITPSGEIRFSQSHTVVHGQLVSVKIANPALRLTGTAAVSHPGNFAGAVSTATGDATILGDAASGPRGRRRSDPKQGLNLAYHPRPWG